MNVMHFRDWHHPRMPGTHQMAERGRHLLHDGLFWAIVAIVALLAIMAGLVMIGGGFSGVDMPVISPFTYGY